MYNLFFINLPSPLSTIRFTMSSFACDFALKTLFKFDVNILGPNTELQIMESWGKDFVKSWVSRIFFCYILDSLKAVIGELYLDPTGCDS